MLAVYRMSRGSDAVSRATGHIPFVLHDLTMAVNEFFILNLLVGFCPFDSCLMARRSTTEITHSCLPQLDSISWSPL
jgi:hypothetical protein